MNNTFGKFLYALLSKVILVKIEKDKNLESTTYSQICDTLIESYK